ncbi:vacuolar protein sorting-associated protein VTA1 homolog [Apostichopus japonicus]|uniref:vacuolar protein sorting-associated protein VTA1 homolog n=1 Tax=Stichopus japonicus TaxID=307972 RepID=UPI003AB12376
MASADIPVPDTLKPIRPYMLLAKQHDNRDKIISYFCMRYAMETAMRLDKRSPEDKTFLFTLMGVLEKRKQELADNEDFQNEMICNSHVENYAIKMFSYADNEDRAGRFNQNLTKTFYKAGLLLDVLQTFGELSEELQAQKKYAKYKAANIAQCLKNGETPKRGPPGGDDDEELPPGGAEAAAGSSGVPSHPGLYPPGQPPPTGMNPPGQPPTGMYPPQTPYPPDQPTDMPAPQRPVQPPNPGNFSSRTQPGAFAPPSTPEQQPAGTMQPQRTNSIQFSPEDFSQATKFCKFAISALQYEDIPAAVTNLENALHLLKTGRV